MYKSGDAYHFMNTENYDQLEMDAEMLGDNAQWMQENMVILAEYYDGQPIGIDLPAVHGARHRRHGAGDEDGHQDGVDQAGDALERRYRQRAGVHCHG